MGAPASALGVIEQEVKALYPTLLLFQVLSIEALVDDALRLERLVAMVHPENVAAARVLTKLGFAV